MALFEKGKGSRNGDIGRASIGLGLMLLALTLPVSTVQPGETAPALRTALGALADERRPGPNLVLPEMPLTRVGRSSAGSGIPDTPPAAK
ncbi:hypothetical protein AWB74_02842 [Caballeronia arvi]|uniref:Uncharacterized protein n=1 Tax=Caballeronia arvi TaxID=1777135 RepID=A0A158IQZ1_9BURK|nr:hypothetical protein [Caballeronia arvi]SAL59132.1 hypothetical protein AWB74_02842 [Caballeronia arvi]